MDRAAILTELQRLGQEIDGGMTMTEDRYAEQKMELRQMFWNALGRKSPLTGLDAVERWFTEPQEVLRGATPDALIEAGKGYEVYQAMQALFAWS